MEFSQDDNAKMLVREILELNKDKPFVQRILAQKTDRSSNSAPSIPAGKDAKGRAMTATHKMGWNSDNRGHHVRPSVYMENGKLKEDPTGRAAMKSGNFITFKTPEEADWFSKNYKRVWD